MKKFYLRTFMFFTILFIMTNIHYSSFTIEFINAKPDINAKNNGKLDDNNNLDKNVFKGDEFQGSHHGQNDSVDNQDKHGHLLGNNPFTDAPPHLGKVIDLTEILNPHHNPQDLFNPPIDPFFNRGHNNHNPFRFGFPFIFSKKLNKPGMTMGPPLFGPPTFSEFEANNKATTTRDNSNNIQTDVFEQSGPGFKIMEIRKHPINSPTNNSTSSTKGNVNANHLLKGPFSFLPFGDPLMMHHPPRPTPFQSGLDVFGLPNFQPPKVHTEIINIPFGPGKFGDPFREDRLFEEEGGNPFKPKLHVEIITIPKIKNLQEINHSETPVPGKILKSMDNMMDAFLGGILEGLFDEDHHSEKKSLKHHNKKHSNSRESSNSSVIMKDDNDNEKGEIEKKKTQEELQNDNEDPIFKDLEDTFDAFFGNKHEDSNKEKKQKKATKKLKEKNKSKVKEGITKAIQKDSKKLDGTHGHEEVIEKEDDYSTENSQNEERVNKHETRKDSLKEAKKDEHIEPLVVINDHNDKYKENNEINHLQDKQAMQNKNEITNQNIKTPPHPTASSSVSNTNILKDFDNSKFNENTKTSSHNPPSPSSMHLVNSSVNSHFNKNQTLNKNTSTSKGPISVDSSSNDIKVKENNKEILHAKPPKQDEKSNSSKTITSKNENVQFKEAKSKVPLDSPISFYKHVENSWNTKIKTLTKKQVARSILKYITWCMLLVLFALAIYGLLWGVFGVKSNQNNSSNIQKTSFCVDEVEDEWKSINKEKKNKYF